MGAGFLAFIAILAVAYFALRGRAIRLREQLQEALRRATERAASNQLPGESMIKCPTCGIYAAPGQQRACDRADCTYR
jgi:hypothetical protein